MTNSRWFGEKRYHTIPVLHVYTVPNNMHAQCRSARNRSIMSWRIDIHAKLRPRTQAGIDTLAEKNPISRQIYCMQNCTNYGILVMLLLIINSSNFCNGACVHKCISYPQTWLIIVETSIFIIFSNVYQCLESTSTVLLAFYNKHTHTHTHTHTILLR